MRPLLIRLVSDCECHRLVRKQAASTRFSAEVCNTCHRERDWQLFIFVFDRDIDVNVIILPRVNELNFVFRERNLHPDRAADKPDAGLHVRCSLFRNGVARAREWHHHIVLFLDSCSRLCLLPSSLHLPQGRVKADTQNLLLESRHRTAARTESKHLLGLQITEVSTVENLTKSELLFPPAQTQLTGSPSSLVSGFGTVLSNRSDSGPSLTNTICCARSSPKYTVPNCTAFTLPAPSAETISTF